jgi:hypothetical protein
MPHENIAKSKDGANDGDFKPECVVAEHHKYFRKSNLIAAPAYHSMRGYFISFFIMKFTAYYFKVSCVI